jgi:PTS system mannose-specific IIB component
VATAWSKSVNPDRIIVVSDGVAKDELRKSLIEQAAPVGIKANVIPIKKLIEIWKNPEFDGLRVLFLFENPEDVVKAVRGGVHFDEINVGSMAYTDGKTNINSVLSVDQNDVDAFKELEKDGAKFDVRKVPSDSAQNLDKLIKDKAEEIKANTK